MFHMGATLWQRKLNIVRFLSAVSSNKVLPANIYKYDICVHSFYRHNPKLPFKKRKYEMTFQKMF